MPILEKIVISDFRNIQLQELEFSPNVNCISGNNGEGKTNLLDAIYYLSMTKSAFSASDRFNFRYGTEEFSIAGTYRMENGLASRFSIKMGSKGDKKIRRDDKAYGKVSDHVGILPIVMVSPADVSLVSESGDERRRFVNAVLSQMDREYMTAMQQYNRLLLQRNRMLKEQVVDRALMEVIDLRMAALAGPLYESRKRFVNELKPIVSDFYKTVSGGSEIVDIEYESDLDKASLDQLLAASFEKDRMLRYTSAGLQRDDFLFMMNGHPIRRYGSQGQQKSFLVSLKFAQYEIMKKNYGFAPTLLLDDVFDKLDMGRISNLLKMVSGSDFGQIFITDSNKVRMAGIVDGLTRDRNIHKIVAMAYDGRNNRLRRHEAVGMDELATQFIKEMKLSSGLYRLRVREAWDAVTGAGRYTLEVSLNKGVMICSISSSVVRNQLYFQREALTRQLNEYLKEHASGLVPDENNIVKDLILR